MQSNSVSRTVRSPLAAWVCLALAISPAWAQTPDLRMSDLVNQGSDYAQREMRNRGFVFIHADQRGAKLWQYWWNARDNVCARVAHVDGRASSIVDVSATDCNQYPQTYGQPAQQPAQPSGDSSRMNNATKAAIAAAAIAGVAMLAHRSHERNEDKHKKVVRRRLQRRPAEARSRDVIPLTVRVSQRPGRLRAAERPRRRPRPEHG